MRITRERADRLQRFLYGKIGRMKLEGSIVGQPSKTQLNALIAEFDSSEGDGIDARYRIKSA